MAGPQFVFTSFQLGPNAETAQYSTFALGVIMTTPLRVSRGFHRLGVFLGTIVFLIGCGTAIILGLSFAGDERDNYENALCALDKAPILLEIEGIGPVHVGKEFLALSTDEQTQTIQEIAVDVSRKKAESAAKKSPENYPKPVTDPEIIRRLEAAEPPSPAPKFQVTNEPPAAELDLKELGCAGWGTVTVQEAIQHREQGFNYPLRLTLFLTFGIAVALAVSFAVYGIVRAIGWVIGGFVAS